LKIPKVLVVFLGVVALATAGCGGSSNAAGGKQVKLDLVAYSTPAEAYADLIKAFNDTTAGADVSFSESYGSSGDQSRAVEAGQHADFVHFALEPDVTREVDAGIVGANWQNGPTKGVIAKSITVFVVRKGNPKDIKTWDDLVKPGVDVVNANPFTSGGARWNVMAAYGAQIEQGKSPADATQYLYDLYKHISVQDDSARDSLATFTGGKGDVLLAYENEAILAKDAGEDIEYVIPPQTISIETVGAVTKNAKEPAAQDFLDFLLSKQGQQIFADHGYRPVMDGVTSANYDFPTPDTLFTIADLGGWSKVKDEFFDDQKGIMAKVEQSIGVNPAA
jgi:sulfate/thiosulfate transport system substrate-binding protein